MARPMSEDLKYFPLDVNMDQDDKIAVIESKHGLAGFGLVIRLFMRIYKGGYYTLWTPREQYLFLRNVPVDIDFLQGVVNDCLEEGVFDQGMFDKYAILTSHGIQKRYIRARERLKKTVIIQEYFLVNALHDDLNLVNVTLISVNVTLTPADAESKPQNKIYKNKINKIEHACAREAVDNDVDKIVDNSVSEELPTGDMSGLNEFLKAYPKPVYGRMVDLVRKEWLQLVNRGVYPRDLLFAAIEYAAFVRISAYEDRFIKLPQNFLAQGTFAGYVPKIDRECPKCKGTGYHEQSSGKSQMAMVECDCKYRLKKAGVKINAGKPEEVAPVEDQ